MLGHNAPAAWGIVPRSVGYLFDRISDLSQETVSPYSPEAAAQEGITLVATPGDRVLVRRKFLLSVSYLQIYNEMVNDLLGVNPTKDMRIRENQRGEPYCEGLTEHICQTPSDVLGLVQRGNASRTTEMTKLNEHSSRSHAILLLVVEQATHAENLETGATFEGFRQAKLNLVDLAGSERVSLSRVAGQRLEEAKRINSSLTVLGNVIGALVAQASGKRSHIPYRDSKLTRVLQDSLGGNCRTILCANISPAASCFQESLFTLKFAARAKKIRTKVSVNELVDDDTLLKRYESEIQALRRELERRRAQPANSGAIVGDDSQSIVHILEQRTKESIREKAERRQLEEKIMVLENQLCSAGLKDSLIRNIESSAVDVSRSLSLPGSPVSQGKHVEYERMKQEYERRLHALERERRAISNDSAALYESVLFKQKELLLAITERLADREEALDDGTEELKQRQQYERILHCKISLLRDVLRVLQKQAPAGAPSFINTDGSLNTSAIPAVAASVGDLNGTSPGSADLAFSRSRSLRTIALDTAVDVDDPEEAARRLEKLCDDAEQRLESVTSAIAEVEANLRRVREMLHADSTTRAGKRRSTGDIPPTGEVAALRSKLEAYQHEAVALQCVITKKIMALTGLLLQSNQRGEPLEQPLLKLTALVDATLSALNMTAMDYKV